MMLTTVIDAYVAKQRSLGMRFESGDVVLRRFCRAIGNRDIGEVTTQALAWISTARDWPDTERT